MERNTSEENRRDKVRIVEPSEIEKESMRMISEELSRRGIVLPADIAPVVRRVIHTTADFDYTETLYFSPGAVRAGISTLEEGITIVTDTNMALAGISKPGLKRLGSSAVCYMADEDVAVQAKELHVTRAVISVRKAVSGLSKCIYAVGNAPTALLELAEQIRAGFRPALVIAVPVGFVNVVESKEEIVSVCKQYGIPCIAAMGRKGGSTVAAAICNALIYKVGQGDVSF